MYNIKQYIIYTNATKWATLFHILFVGECKTVGALYNGDLLINQNTYTAKNFITRTYISTYTSYIHR